MFKTPLHHAPRWAVSRAMACKKTPLCGPFRFVRHSLLQEHFSDAAWLGWQGCQLSCAPLGVLAKRTTTPCGMGHLRRCMTTMASTSMNFVDGFFL